MFALASTPRIVASLIRAALGLTLLSALAAAQAQSNLPLNAQGRVTVDGLAFNGTGRFKFALVQSTGRALLWNNDGSTALPNFEPTASVSLPVTRGLYSVLLGDTNIAGMTKLIPPAIFDNSDVRLRVWFNDGTHGFQQLTPDQRLAAVGHAMKALVATEAETFNGPVALTQIPATVVTNNSTNLTLGGAFTGNGSGLVNIRGSTPWQVAAGNTAAAPNTGYLVTNAAQISIALPPTAELTVGDVIRVAGPNPGAWKITQGAGQSILASSFKGGIGLVWNSRDSARAWTGVASSSDGAKLAAVINSTTLAAIYLSTNSGASWATPPVSPSKRFHAITSSADGERLLAAIEGDLLLMSTDAGQNWTPRNTPGNRTWTGVGSSADGTNLVAVAATGQLYTSADGGEVWTLRASAGTRGWNDAAVSANAATMVAAAAGDRLIVSKDKGVSWNDFNSPVANWIAVASSANGLRLVAVAANNFVYTSVNGGTNWVARNSSGSRVWSAVVISADGNKIAATSDAGIFISLDAGNTWVAQNRVSSALAANADFSQIVGVGNAIPIQITQSARMTATTVGAAGYIVGDEAAAVELQHIGDGRFLPLSLSGTIFAY
jgi:hypothetical protein